MHQEPFQLFGIQHLVTLVFLFCFNFLYTCIFQKEIIETKKIIGVSLSVLLLAHTFEQVLNTFSFNLNWQEAFPLHMCDLSALSIAYYLITREKIYFNCAYFWGLGGATMALLTPDVDFAFPNPVFSSFSFGLTH